MWLGKFEFHQQAAIFRIRAKCEFSFGIFAILHPACMSWLFRIRLQKFKFQQQAALFRIWAKCGFTFENFAVLHLTSSRNRQGKKIQHLQCISWLPRTRSSFQNMMQSVNSHLRDIFPGFAIDLTYSNLSLTHWMRAQSLHQKFNLSHR